MRKCVIKRQIIIIITNSNSKFGHSPCSFVLTMETKAISTERQFPPSLASLFGPEFSLQIYMEFNENDRNWNVIIVSGMYFNCRQMYTSKFEYFNIPPPPRHQKSNFPLPPVKFDEGPGFTWVLGSQVQVLRIADASVCLLCLENLTLMFTLYYASA